MSLDIQSCTAAAKQSRDCVGEWTGVHGELRRRGAPLQMGVGHGDCPRSQPWVAVSTGVLARLALAALLPLQCSCTVVPWGLPALGTLLNHTRIAGIWGSVGHCAMMTISHWHPFRICACTSPGEETPHGRCYVCILGRVVTVDGEDLKDAFVSLNAPLIFPMVVILTQSVAPTALSLLVFFSQPGDADAGHCGHTLQSIFATLRLSSSGRWFLLPAGDRLVYSTTLCRGCSSQEVRIFPAHFLISFFSPRAEIPLKERTTCSSRRR